MFERRHILDKQVADLTEYTLKKERGDLIKHEEIIEVTGLARGVSPWTAFIKRWKKAVMDAERIVLRSCPGIGYRLANFEGQIEAAIRKEKSSMRGLMVAGLWAGVLPEGELSEGLKVLQKSIVFRATQSRLEFNTTIAERKAILSKQESLPRIELSGVK